MTIQNGIPGQKKLFYDIGKKLCECRSSSYMCLNLSTARMSGWPKSIRDARQYLVADFACTHVAQQKNHKVSSHSSSLASLQLTLRASESGSPTSAWGLVTSIHRIHSGRHNELQRRQPSHLGRGCSIIGTHPNCFYFLMSSRPNPAS